MVLVRRSAALKCRQRKKAWLAQLQAKVEFLQNENERLSQALISAREEITRLSALAGTGAPPAVTVVPSAGVPLSAHPHAHGGHGRPSESPTGGIAPVAVNVSVPGGAPAKGLAAPAPQAGMVGAGGGRGYGY